ncbi:uncharacterized protein PV09_08696 [Verruconis gallopava]|uniref:Ketoreductase (KR) domain-containing protein n=1 Tax=Verruconis gallopava TaxID=253628 RepID=A0A0D1YFV6_9PEZI|nr:uncharacterized protein PV09_08696 [Verruconis gallopava]KIV99631.1 hypothetical protein PV09_08696 [Verruconis gallopava]
MSPKTRAIAIFGVGPGIGRAVAVQFASQGFSHLILLSRNAQRLQENKVAVMSAAGSLDISIYTIVVDLSSQASLQAAFDHIDSLGLDLEVALYNGARVSPTPLFETPVQEIEADFKTTTVGLYSVAKWVLPKLQIFAKAYPHANPSLIVTGGFLHKTPIPEFFTLSLVKTAQRNLVQSLHQVYNPQGVHVGLVLVGGMVSPEAKVLNPTHIAKLVWEFFENRNDLEVELEDK